MSTDTDVVYVPHRMVEVGRRGQPLNEAAHMCRHPDSVVAAARSMHAKGETYKAISAALGGVSVHTIETWVTFKKRPLTASRVVLKPIKS